MGADHAQRPAVAPHALALREQQPQAAGIDELQLGEVDLELAVGGRGAEQLLEFGCRREIQLAAAGNEQALTVALRAQVEVLA